MIMWSRVWDFVLSLVGRTAAMRLYERVKRYAALSDTSICMLHNAEPKTPCPQSRYFCGNESKKQAVNFDAVKEEYCRRNRINGSWPSVDAVLFKDNTFLFVEIKSWRNFEEHQINANDTQEEKERKIKAKAQGFKLKQKIESSMDICCDLSKDKKLFERIPIVYVLVTDVATQLSPMELFRARLGVLSYKAVNVPLYAKASIAQLNALSIPVRYKFCQEFDDFYDSL
jgi:Holliday junction resolvase-like predicted endonuclease